MSFAPWIFWTKFCTLIDDVVDVGEANFKLQRKRLEWFGQWHWITVRNIDGRRYKGISCLLLAKFLSPQTTS
jgi:hypothetical protein